MYVSGRLGHATRVVCIGLVSLFLVPSLAHAAPTPEQAASLRAFGMDPAFAGYETVLKMLWGGCAYDPYQRLEKLKSSASVQITPKVAASGATPSEIKGGIHPTLACRLTKLIDAFPECNIKINSAYRAVQPCKPGPGCAPQGSSCHQYGLAVDIGSSCQAKLAQFLGVKTSTSQGAQQFKLHFGYQLAGSYPNHIQCVENGVAGCNVNTKGCDGNGAIKSDSSYAPPSSPTSNFSDAIRQALGMPTAQQLPAIPAAAAPIPTTASPLTSFTSPTPVSDTITNPSAVAVEGATSSIASRLADLIASTSNENASVTATTVPVVVTSSGARSLTGTNPNGSTEPSATAYIGSSVQQTFTSQDSSWQGQPTSPTTATQNILSNLRAVLLRMLEYLRPFGRPAHSDDEQLE